MIHSRVWIRYFTILYSIISSICVIFLVNLDDFFAVVCTNFHEVGFCTRYVGEGSSGARAVGLGRRRRALPWPLDGPIQRLFFFRRRGALPAQGTDPGFDS